MTTILLSPRRLSALAVPLLALAIAGPPSTTPAPCDAVRQTEQRWLEAEFRGDTAYLDGLLLPEYRSVSSNGTHDRAAILAAALRHAANHDPVPASLAPDVAVHGSTAIATFTRPDTSSSADVFVLDHGSWRAYYSQHTLLTPPAAPR